MWVAQIKDADNQTVAYYMFADDPGPLQLSVHWIDAPPPEDET